MTEHPNGLQLFVYGTLCIPEVRHRLLRRTVIAEPGLLRDAEVRRVRGQTYPTIVLGRAGSTAQGMVLGALSAEEHGVLRGFEPAEYRICEVEVERGALHERCLTFIRDGGRNEVAGLWTPDTFDGDDYDAFLAEVGCAADALWGGQPFRLDARRH